jgi:hypothetical protein
MLVTLLCPQGFLSTIYFCPNKASELAKQRIAADFGIPLNPTREEQGSALWPNMSDSPTSFESRGLSTSLTATKTPSYQVRPLQDDDDCRQARQHAWPSPGPTSAQNKTVVEPPPYRPGAARRAALALQKISEHPIPQERVW